MKNLNKCLASNDVLTDEEKRTFRIEALRHRKGDNNLNQTQASIAIATKYINEFEEEIGVIDKLLVEYDKKALKAIRKPEKPDVKESVTTETEKDSIDTSPHAKLSDWVASRLEKKAPIKSQELFRQADINYNGTQGDRAYSVKDAYDAMELGVNKFIESKGYSPDVSAEKAQTIVNSLSSYTKLLATQTKRTKEQNEFQQFSTPPAFAFIANWVGGVNKKDVMLEPSAGIGGIAVFAKNAGAKVFVNEFSERRVGFLKELGFDKIFTEDAAQLDNVLPEEIKPTVIIMNPPFSATAGRTSRNATMNGAKHIEQALERLEPEGRLVAIVGQGMALNKIHFKEWWDKIKKEYNVRANIGVSGKEYTKYGTSFDNQIIVIDKSGETDIIIDGKVDSFSELIPVLKDLHKEGRYELTKNKKQQSIASESGSESGVDKTERTDRDRSASLPTVDGLVGGESISVQDGNAGASALPTTRDKPAQIDKSDGLPEKGESATGPEGISTDLDTKPTRMDSRRDSRVSDGSKSEIERTNARTGKGKKEISSAVYDKYIPSVTVKGSKTHITPLVESAAMADSQAPESTYTPNLPKTPIKKGFITDAQLEAIIYAGEAHQQFLKSGERKGFFIGDGTGVGKGREISGIIWDNFRRGDKKAIWLSEKASLLNDAKRDLKGVGWSKGADKVFGLTKTKLGEKIKQKDGILFTQYATLRGKFKDIREDQEETLKDLAIRLNQITKWAGKDFDGVIAFDESHNMGNNIPTRGKRGTTKPAAQALAGVMLQKLLPKAKVVYVSATGATEVSNLAYATRLGLWGEGTPFKNVLDFVEQISGEGISAMELVARDMKSLGMYLARSLSYADVKYERLEHELSPPQTKIYDTLAEGWQLVLGNINEAVEETDGGTTARSAALSQFWGAHQRFFNQIVTAMQMPTVLKKMRKDINDGKAIVVQLINTHATQLENSIALLEDGQGVEDIDMTPRATLMNFIDRSFPTKQYEEFEDENGDVRTRIVYDSKGKAVHNKKALGMKKQLLQDMGGISVPNTALDMIVQEFGVEAVAEVTGRKRRIVYDKDGNKIIQKWSDAKAQKDIRDYMDDKKQILIFSEKGGTGSSYHAAMDAKNKRLRRHYLIQPGWIASKAVQGLGRSHRSFQKQAPEFILATTNLPGQKRFLSSIAKRLDQLGALTKGQRQTGSQGIFAAKDNLESTHAKDGLRNFFDKLFSGRYKDLTAEEYERQTGISFYDSEGNLKKELPEMTTFLNRMLSMTQDTQNKVFDYFSTEMDAVIQRHSDLGTLDVGLETITGDSIKVVREDVAFEDKEKNIEAKYVQFELKHLNRSRVKFSKTSYIADKPKYFINKTSKKIRLRDMGSESERTDTKTGEIKKYYKLVNPKGNSVMAEADTFNKKWEEVSKSKAKPIWDTEYKEAPKQITENLHLLTGTLLPLWDRLKGRMAVARLQTDDGKRYLGRKIDSEVINSVLDNLGMDKEKIEMTGEQVAGNVLAGGTVQFHNKTKLKRSRVAGENRIEYVSTEPYYNLDSRELEAYGLFSEQINWKTRWFVPSGDKAPGVIDKIADGKDIVSVKAASRKTNVDDIKFSTSDDFISTLTPDKDTFQKAMYGRIEKKYKTLFGIHESALSHGDYQSIVDRKRAPKTLDKKIQSADNKQEYIGNTESAIADLLGDLQETYRYESFEEGKRIEDYIDSLLEVTQKYKVSKRGVPDKVSPSKVKEKLQKLSDRSGVDEAPAKGLTLKDIQSRFKNQAITINPDNSISIRFKNGLGLKIRQVSHIAGQDYQYAIESGRMTSGGVILGKYQDSEIVLNKTLADNFTKDHELYHFLTDKNVITKVDKLLLNAKLKAYKREGNLSFNKSTLKNKKIANEENEANMFAQLLEEREKYGNTPIGRMIQKVVDFVNGLIYIGKSSAMKLTGIDTTALKSDRELMQAGIKLADEVISGKIFEREISETYFDQLKKSLSLHRKNLVEYKKVLELPISKETKEKFEGKETPVERPQRDIPVLIRRIQVLEEAINQIEGGAVFQVAPDKKTPEFKEWFGDSKVIDENGEPLVVYHGTDVDFTVFDIDRGELGAHFGTKEIAVDRIELSEDPAFTKGDQVKPVYLSLQNPYDMVSDLGDWNDMGMLEEHLAEANEGPFTNEEFSKFKTSRDVREGLIKKGYDGIKYINTFEYAPEGEAGSYIAFSPNQVKSVFNLKPTKASQDIRYQTSEDRASTTSQTAERIYTPDQQAYKQAGGFGQKKTETFREKFDKIKILAGDKLRQGTVDQFHSLNKVLKDKQAWMMAHLTKSDTGVLMTAINEGMPVLDPSGAVDIKEGSKSLKEILAPLGQETDDFLAWIAANRSEKLLAEDRENLFTPEQIAAGKTLNKGREELYNDVKKDFEEMGAAITDIAVKTNLVNEEEAQQWKEEGFYVPFYRMLEEQETSRRGPGNINGLTNQKAYKKLKGGKSQLNDLLTNTLLNWNHLISAGLRNQAGKKALESAVEMDIASIVPKEIKSKDAVYIRDNGQEVWYELDQTPEGQLVLDSIMSLSYEGLNTPAMKTMRMFKRVLTQGVTASPGFKIRNLIRDSLHAPAVTTASKNPLKNIAVGFKYKADMKRMEAGGGAFSQEGYIHGNDPDAMKRLIGVASSSILNTPNKIALMWRKYENFGNTLENINRVASFKKDLAKGKSLLEANFNARDQLDFSRSGSFSAIRVLTQTIPFLNARMQGLDKIGRAVIDPAQRKQLAQVMGMYTIASVSLMLMMAGDDDYDEAPEWEKRTYHMFKIPGVDKMFRIPRPFEVGAIAYMSEEMAKQFADENSKAEDLGMALYHTLSDTFAMSIVPQAFKPMLEVYANKDSFRNTPIESMSMRNLSKKARYRPWTSKLAKGTSYAMSEVLPEGATLSPVQIQHLVRAYTGWAGATTLASIDFMLKKISGEITPETKISEYTWNPVSSFARDSGAKSTKYVTKFYDNMSELNKMWADIGKYRKTSGGKKVTAAQRNKLRYRKRYNRISKKLSSLRKQGELIYTSTSLTATQKRLRLKKLNIRKNALAKRTITISKEVF